MPRGGPKTKGQAGEWRSALVGEMEGWEGGLEQRRTFGEQGRKLLEINPFTYFDPGDRT